MTLEEQILELHQNIFTGGIEQRLSAEARAKLEDLAHRSALLSIEATEIIQEEAARLATTREEEAVNRSLLGMLNMRMTVEEGLRLAPENLSVNPHSM